MLSNPSSTPTKVWKFEFSSK